MASWYKKDPDAVLDYKWDWTDWLDTEETIDTVTVTAPTGITVDSYSITDAGKSVTAWISGGTLGKTYDVVCHVVTSDGREEDETMVLKIGDK